jgi:two-component system, NtrC family, nitrogen regulation response regulator NtrX
LLVEKFLSDLANETGARRKDITKDAIQALQANEWTGNIRELRNVIERLVIMSDSMIDQNDVKKYL